MLHDSVMASLLDPGLVSDAVAFVELTARWITALLKVSREEGRMPPPPPDWPPASLRCLNAWSVVTFSSKGRGCQTLGFCGP